jgi:phytoene synthase
LRATAGIEIRNLYEEAARVTAQGSKSFYFATRFFPRRLAESAHAVYWFCRHTDDLVDEAPDPATGSRQIEEWAMEVERALLQREARHPVLIAFLDAVERHGIPHDYPMELIEGMRMDARGTRYATFAELRVFCYRVASVVGLMMSHVIGFEEPALDYATDLGIAMQLTNILRDIREDWELRRVYLPSEEMARFGYSMEDLAARRKNDALRALLQFQVARARDYYTRALPGIALLRPEGRFAVQVAADVYREILTCIERSDYDVFGPRAVVPARTKYWLTARSMAVPAARSALRGLQVWKG